MPGIKGGLLLINMAAMTLQMWPFLQRWQDHRGLQIMFESILTKWKWTSEEGWEGGDHLPAGRSRQCQGFYPCASEREKGWVSSSRTSDKGKDKLFSGWRKEKCPWKSKRGLLEDLKVKGESAMSNQTLTKTSWRERKDSWWIESSGGGQQHPMWPWPCSRHH